MLLQPAPASGGGIEDGGNPVNPSTNPADSKASYASLYNKKQLAILCLARLAEPLVATSIQVWLLHMH